MDQNNNIVSKYINILSVVSKYATARNSKEIIPQDIFVCMVHLFSKNTIIRIFFNSYDLDLEKILSIYSQIYNFSKINLIETGVYTFSLNKRAITILEQLEEIKDMDLFTLNLFLDLLYDQDILTYVMDEKSGLDKVVESLDLKSIFERAYEEKTLKKEFGQIFNLNTLLKEELEKNSTAQDDYSDFDLDEDEDDEDEETDKKLETAKKDGKLVLDTFATDLVDMAKKGKLEPVVGREKELNEVIYTLLRKTKSNPLLIGEAGVGKTAIVEGLAQKIADKKVPEKLKNKKIYNLDMGTLVAGTKFRGEFEARLKSIIEEAINPENNIILFVDEIHTMVGAGNQEGGADTANIIKPHLARGELTVIGATTFNEYKKYIEKDPALTRRFQTIKIEEPSEQEAIKLIEGVKYRFEDFHGVNIEKDAIEEAVKLSKRYILDRFLPDKAFDLVDEACSRKSSSNMSKEKIKEIKKLNSKIEKIEKKIEKAVKEQDYFAAADYKEEIKQIKEKIHNLQSMSDTPKELRENITKEDIQNVIAEKYGVSTSILSKSELEFLKSLKKKINKKIIGQESAVEDVVNAIIRNKFSPIEKTKPIGSFLFLGPSGVGKTYLAQLLAEEYFQNKDALIKINMSEYSQDISSSKLTGSAPGYVGYEEGGQLTEAVRKKPYSVVLFDEIEKGSSSVLNVLLQILDQGYLEDNKGRKVDFKNTIIILTSNIGAEYFGKEVAKVGFSLEKNSENKVTEEKKEIILQEVKNLLPIELINRFDKIVFFNNIDKNLLTEIFKKYYKDYKKIWKDKKGITIPNLRKDKIEEIINKIYKEGAGVRGVEKYIHNELETKIIEDMIK